MIFLQELVKYPCIPTAIEDIRSKMSIRYVSTVCKRLKMNQTKEEKRIIIDHSVYEP
jgi:hypothetical protein